MHTGCKEGVLTLNLCCVRSFSTNNVLASRTADGYLNDFQQTWGSRLPGPGAGVASVRPGGHVQREIRKRKADGISRSAAEMHSFACIEDLSERAADRLLTFTTNVICLA